VLWGGIGVCEVADHNDPNANERALRSEAARGGFEFGKLIPDRSCGTCMMCCKVYTIRELNKPAGRWCVHAERGRGCKIYGSHPATCKGFYCDWRADPTLRPEWKPDKAHFILSVDLSFYRAVTVTPDPAMPDAWKREPYYSAIKRWATRFVRENKKILVVHRGFVTVVPDREVPIGVVPPGQEIVISQNGATYDASLQPRAALPSRQPGRPMDGNRPWQATHSI
jgi:hypothetical protein